VETTRIPNRRHGIKFWKKKSITFSQRKELESIKILQNQEKEIIFQCKFMFP
jgi:hypothetical protein